MAEATEVKAVGESKRKRAYMFTLNNYLPEDQAKVLAWEGVKYVVFGLEVGESGTPHFQGYVEWIEGKAVVPTLKKLDPRIHWDERMATAQTAKAYCCKGIQTKAEWTLLGVKGPTYGRDAKVFESGKMSAQGKRSDIKDCAEMVVCGASLRDVALENPAVFVKYHKGFVALKNVLMTHRTEPPTVRWIWGLAGVGKTRGPVERHIASHYIKDNTTWWDGYEQQEAIIIDDFDAKAWNYRALLQLLDRYQYQGQYKGGYVPINSPYIYITCEHAPPAFWAGNELAQVMRRLASVEELGIA